jgi:hypothetical protein
MSQTRHYRGNGDNKFGKNGIEKCAGVLNLTKRDGVDKCAGFPNLTWIGAIEK